MRYYIIAPHIPEGYRENGNVFTSATTCDGYRVCAVASVTEFPGLFLGETLTLVDLDCSDFPAPPATGLA